MSAAGRWKPGGPAALRKAVVVTWTDSAWCWAAYVVCWAPDVLRWPATLLSWAAWLLWARLVLGGSGLWLGGCNYGDCLWTLGHCPVLWNDARHIRTG